MHKTLPRMIMSITGALILFIGFTAPTFAATSQQPHFTTTFFFNAQLTNTGNPGWAHFTDSNAHSSAYTDANGSVETSQAFWNFGLKGNCDYYVYVPYENATATITYGFYSFGIRVGTYTINQQPLRGYIYIGTWTTINQVKFSNNNGQRGTRIGVGTTNSLQVNC